MSLFVHSIIIDTEIHNEKITANHASRPVIAGQCMPT